MGLGVPLLALAIILLLGLVYLWDRVVTGEVDILAAVGLGAFGLLLAYVAVHYYDILLILALFRM